MPICPALWLSLFLSTSPARGTTAEADRELLDPRNFYPRPPRGGRRAGPGYRPTARRFLSTSPARGTTQRILFRGLDDTQFLSTSPARGTTPVLGVGMYLIRISIHVPREGDDCSVRCAPAPGRDFYPRPPRGGRRAGALDDLARGNFYPRPPRGGRLLAVQSYAPTLLISIHVPREGDD